jgi:CcmD family protein
MDERNFMFMFYGFSAAWVILALYALTLVRRERRLQSQLDSLKKMVEDREKK